MDGSGTLRYLSCDLNTLGIEIGGTKLQLVLGDERGEICEKRRLPVVSAEGAEGIRKQMARTLRELIRDKTISAVGVGFGGPVDWKSGKICRSHQVEGWSEFDLAAWLEQQVGAPVFVDNDANVGALGEACHGSGAGFDSVFYVTLGSGVGGGLVSHGEIYHGAAPGESEIGHVRLHQDGTTVESRCSGWAVDARIRQLKNNEPDGLLARLCHDMPGSEAKHLGHALAQRDPAARQILTEIAADLAFGLSHVVHLFHPQVIILGGGLAKIGEPLANSVADALRPYVMEAFRSTFAIRLAALGEDAVTVGALALARRRREAQLAKLSS